ncbi:MAG: hypothetical protein WDZ80_00745 [Candidatus Paceibacterota bacterium]
MTVRRHIPTAQVIYENLDNLHICLSGHDFCISRVNRYKCLLHGTLAKTKEGPEVLLGQILQGMIIGHKKFLKRTENDSLGIYFGKHYLIDDFVNDVVKELKGNGAVQTGKFLLGERAA